MSYLRQDYNANLFNNSLILIVDDDPSSLDIVRTLLEMRNGRTLTAVNGKRALDVLENHTPAFIVCDISMPVMDGWDFLKSVRADEKLAEIPVIALTAHALRGDRERVLEAGFSGYMTKPIIPRVFAVEIKDLVEKTPAIRVRISS
ncbi:MAG: response regulator [Aggregatilineales bacterium]